MAYLLSSLGLVSQTASFTSVTGHVNNALYTVGSATNQNSSVANTAVNVFLVSEQVEVDFNSYSNVASLVSITTNNVVTSPVIITSSVDSVNYLNLNRGFTTTYSGLGDVVFLTARSTNSSNVQLLDLSKNNITLVANSNVAVSANGPVTDDNPTYKSLFFNGTDRSWVRVTDSSVFDFGVGDFTIEFFVRPYSFATTGSVVDNWISGGAVYIPGQWQVRYVGTNGVLAFNYATSSSANSIVLQTAAAATPLNTWTHVAIVRNNGAGKNRTSSGVAVNNLFLYVNGQAVSGTLSNAYIGVNITGNSSSIGRTTWGNTNFFQGNVSNLRVSKKAVYTGNVYTVPTVRLELIQNAVTTGNANVSALVSGNTVATVSVNTETRTALIPSYTASGPVGPSSVEYLVVAGGGSGGGYYWSGGGGAGGYRSSVVGEMSGGGASAESPAAVSAGVTYTVTVGGGGTAVSGEEVTGFKGGNSSIIGGAVSIVSLGGGGGGPNSIGGNPGGGVSTSAGGADGGSGGGSAEPTVPAGSGTTGQGYAGGTGSTHYAGGGGGGAGAAALNTSLSNTPTNGGVGVQTSISGTPTYYAGGGAGSTGGSVGGLGGGGDGTGTSPGRNGTVNTGGGGGGNGSTGGSGIVIIRHPSILTTASTTGSPNVITSGGYTVYTFTSSGTITFNQAVQVQPAANTLIRYIELGSQTITVTNNLNYNSAVTTANVRRVIDNELIRSSMNLLASNNVYQTSLTSYTPSFVLSGIDANPNNPNQAQAVIKNASRINDPARIDLVPSITRPAFFQSGITGENVIDQQNWF
jgi:hypothetical protein